MSEPTSKPIEEPEKPKALPVLDNERVMPVYDRAFRHDFVRAKPWLISVDDVNPRGHYDTSFFAVGREIEIENHLRFIWPRVELAGDIISKRVEPYLQGLVMRIPSGQLVYAPLKFYQDPDEYFRFKTPTYGNQHLAELIYPDATVFLQITKEWLDIEDKPLDFDLRGYDALMFSLGVNLSGRFDRRGMMLVETSHVNCSWVTEGGGEETRVAEGPWRNAFDLVGYRLGIKGGVGKIYNPNEDN